MISTFHRAKVLCPFRQQLGEAARSLATRSQPALAKQDISTDNQGDSSGDKDALNESRAKAEEQDNVAAEKRVDPEAKGEAKFDPEVKNKSGKSFPHQTQDERMGRVASTTEGEAPVKTREYSPKEGTKLYSEK